MIELAKPEMLRSHAGAERLISGFAAVHRMLAQLRSAKGLASVLVAGGVAAAIVVADQIVGAWADGHLMLAWVAMWAIVFALLAAFSDAIRSWPGALHRRVEDWALAANQRAADERTWAAAQADPRLMKELQFARMRADQEALGKGLERPHWPFDELPAHRPAAGDWA